MRLPTLDLRDSHFYGGLLLSAIGGWQLSRPLTCVAIGLILAGVGYFMPRRGKA